MKKERNSNIELLRIVSIILIVISHYVVHGIGIENLNAMPLSITKVFLQALVLGNLGTILFVLISGYYLINSKEIKLKKIIKLILQVVFYSSVIYIVLVLLHKEPFTFKNLIIAFFPITFKTYWFATAYIILYIFHPFINRFLNSLKQKEPVFLRPVPGIVICDQLAAAAFSGSFSFFSLWLFAYSSMHERMNATAK